MKTNIKIFMPSFAKKTVSLLSAFAFLFTQVLYTAPLLAVDSPETLKEGENTGNLVTGQQAVEQGTAARMKLQSLQNAENLARQSTARLKAQAQSMKLKRAQKGTGTAAVTGTAAGATGAVRKGVTQDVALKILKARGQAAAPAAGTGTEVLSNTTITAGQTTTTTSTTTTTTTASVTTAAPGSAKTYLPGALPPAAAKNYTGYAPGLPALDPTVNTAARNTLEGLKTAGRITGYLPTTAANNGNGSAVLIVTGGKESLTVARNAMTDPATGAVQGYEERVTGAGGTPGVAFSYDKNFTMTGAAVTFKDAQGNDRTASFDKDMHFTGVDGNTTPSAADAAAALAAIAKAAPAWDVVKAGREGAQANPMETMQANLADVADVSLTNEKTLADEAAVTYEESGASGIEMLSDDDIAWALGQFLDSGEYGEFVSALGEELLSTFNPDGLGTDEEVQLGALETAVEVNWPGYKNLPGEGDETSINKTIAGLGVLLNFIGRIDALETGAAGQTTDAAFQAEADALLAQNSMGVTTGEVARRYGAPEYDGTYDRCGEPTVDAEGYTVWKDKETGKRVRRQIATANGGSTVINYDDNENPRNITTLTNLQDPNTKDKTSKQTVTSYQANALPPVLTKITERENVTDMYGVRKGYTYIEDDKTAGKKTTTKYSDIERNANGQITRYKDSVTVENTAGEKIVTENTKKIYAGQPLGIASESEAELQILGQGLAISTTAMVYQRNVLKEKVDTAFVRDEVKGSEKRSLSMKYEAIGRNPQATVNADGTLGVTYRAYDFRPLQQTDISRDTQGNMLEVVSDLKTGVRLLTTYANVTYGYRGDIRSRDIVEKIMIKDNIRGPNGDLVRNTVETVTHVPPSSLPVTQVTKEIDYTGVSIVPPVSQDPNDPAFIKYKTMYPSTCGAVVKEVTTEFDTAGLPHRISEKNASGNLVKETLNTYEDGKLATEEVIYYDGTGQPEKDFSQWNVDELKVWGQNMQLTLDPYSYMQNLSDEDKNLVNEKMSGFWDKHAAFMESCNFATDATVVRDAVNAYVNALENLVRDVFIQTKIPLYAAELQKGIDQLKNPGTKPPVTVNLAQMGTNQLDQLNALQAIVVAEIQKRNIDANDRNNPLINARDMLGSVLTNWDDNKTNNPEIGSNTLGIALTKLRDLGIGMDKVNAIAGLKGNVTKSVKTEFNTDGTAARITETNAQGNLLKDTAKTYANGKLDTEVIHYYDGTARPDAPITVNVYDMAAEKLQQFKDLKSVVTAEIQKKGVDPADTANPLNAISSKLDMMINNWAYRNNETPEMRVQYNEMVGNALTQARDLGIGTDLVNAISGPPQGLLNSERIQYVYKDGTPEKQVVTQLDRQGNPVGNPVENLWDGQGYVNNTGPNGGTLVPGQGGGWIETVTVTGGQRLITLGADKTTKISEVETVTLTDSKQQITNIMYGTDGVTRVNEKVEVKVGGKLESETTTVRTQDGFLDTVTAKTFDPASTISTPLGGKILTETVTRYSKDSSNTVLGTTTNAYTYNESGQWAWKVETKTGDVQSTKVVIYVPNPNNSEQMQMEDTGPHNGTLSLEGDRLMETVAGAVGRKEYYYDNNMNRVLDRAVRLDSNGLEKDMTVTTYLPDNKQTIVDIVISPTPSAARYDVTTDSSGRPLSISGGGVQIYGITYDGGTITGATQESSTTNADGSVTKIVTVRDSDHTQPKIQGGKQWGDLFGVQITELLSPIGIATTTVTDSMNGVKTGEMTTIHPPDGGQPSTIVTQFDNAGNRTTVTTTEFPKPGPVQPGDNKIKADQIVTVVTFVPGTDTPAQKTETGTKNDVEVLWKNYSYDATQNPPKYKITAETYTEDGQGQTTIKTDVKYNNDETPKGKTVTTTDKDGNETVQNFTFVLNPDTGQLDPKLLGPKGGILEPVQGGGFKESLTLLGGVQQREYFYTNDKQLIREVVNSKNGGPNGAQVQTAVDYQDGKSIKVVITTTQKDETKSVAEHGYVNDARTKMMNTTVTMYDNKNNKTSEKLFNYDANGNKQGCIENKYEYTSDKKPVKKIVTELDQNGRPKGPSQEIPWDPDANDYKKPGSAAAASSSAVPGPIVTAGSSGAPQGGSSGGGTNATASGGASGSGTPTAAGSSGAPQGGSSGGGTNATASGGASGSSDVSSTGNTTTVNTGNATVTGGTTNNVSGQDTTVSGNTIADTTISSFSVAGSLPVTVKSYDQAAGGFVQNGYSINGPILSRPTDTFSRGTLVSRGSGGKDPVFQVGTENVRVATNPEGSSADGLPLDETRGWQYSAVNFFQCQKGVTLFIPTTGAANQAAGFIVRFDDASNPGKFIDVNFNGSGTVTAISDSTSPTPKIINRDSANWQQALSAANQNGLLTVAADTIIKYKGVLDQTWPSGTAGAADSSKTDFSYPIPGRNLGAMDLTNLQAQNAADDQTNVTSTVASTNNDVLINMVKDYAAAGQTFGTLPQELAVGNDEGVMTGSMQNFTNKADNTGLTYDYTTAGGIACHRDITNKQNGGTIIVDTFADGCVKTIDTSEDDQQKPTLRTITMAKPGVGTAVSTTYYTQNAADSQTLDLRIVETYTPAGATAPIREIERVITRPDGTSNTIQVSYSVKGQEGLSGVFVFTRTKDDGIHSEYAVNSGGTVVGTIGYTQIFSHFALLRPENVSGAGTAASGGASSVVGNATAAFSITDNPAIAAADGAKAVYTPAEILTQMNALAAALTNGEKTVTIRGETVTFASMAGWNSPPSCGDYYLNDANGKPIMYVGVRYSGDSRSGMNTLYIQKYCPGTYFPQSLETYAYTTGAETKDYNGAYELDVAQGGQKLAEFNFAGQVLAAPVSADDAAAFNQFIQERISATGIGHVFRNDQDLRPGFENQRLSGEFMLGGQRVSYTYGVNTPTEIVLLRNAGGNDPNGKAFILNEFNKWRNGETESSTAGNATTTVTVTDNLNLGAQSLQSVMDWNTAAAWEINYDTQQGNITTEWFSKIIDQMNKNEMIPGIKTLQINAGTASDTIRYASAVGEAILDANGVFTNRIYLKDSTGKTFGEIVFTGDRYSNMNSMTVRKYAAGDTAASGTGGSTTQTGGTSQTGVTGNVSDNVTNDLPAGPIDFTKLGYPAGFVPLDPAVNPDMRTYLDTLGAANIQAKPFSANQQVLDFTVGGKTVQLQRMVENGTMKDFAYINEGGNSYMIRVTRDTNGAPTATHMEGPNCSLDFNAKDEVVSQWSKDNVQSRIQTLLDLKQFIPPAAPVTVAGNAADTTGGFSNAGWDLILSEISRIRGEPGTGSTKSVTIRGQTYTYTNISTMDGALGFNINDLTDGQGNKVRISTNNYLKMLSVAQYVPGTDHVSASAAYSYKDGGESVLVSESNYAYGTDSKDAFIDKGFARTILGTTATPADVEQFNDFIRESLAVDQNTELRKTTGYDPQKTSYAGIFNMMANGQTVGVQFGFEVAGKDDDSPVGTSSYTISGTGNDAKGMIIDAFNSWKADAANNAGNTADPNTGNTTNVAVMNEQVAASFIARNYQQAIAQSMQILEAVKNGSPATQEELTDAVFHLGWSYYYASDTQGVQNNSTLAQMCFLHANLNQTMGTQVNAGKLLTALEKTQSNNSGDWDLLSMKKGALDEIAAGGGVRSDGNGMTIDLPGNGVTTFAKVEKQADGGYVLYSDTQGANPVARVVINDDKTASVTTYEQGTTTQGTVKTFDYSSSQETQTGSQPLSSGSANTVNTNTTNTTTNVTPINASGYVQGFVPLDPARNPGIQTYLTAMKEFNGGVDPTVTPAFKNAETGGSFGITQNIDGQPELKTADSITLNFTPLGDQVTISRAANTKQQTLTDKVISTTTGYMDTVSCGDKSVTRYYDLNYTQVKTEASTNYGTPAALDDPDITDLMSLLPPPPTATGAGDKLN